MKSRESKGLVSRHKVVRPRAWDHVHKVYKYTSEPSLLLRAFLGHHFCVATLEVILWL